MNTDWPAAMIFVFEQEGGYSNDPNDPGGETNYGISKASYPNEDIKNMTKERASDIYFKDYWEACSCDQLPSLFATAVFDCAVNQGTKKAGRLLQIALDVPVDGIIGSQTVTAAHNAGMPHLKKFLYQRLHDYTRDSDFVTYEQNWFTRILNLYQLVLTGGTT